MYPITIDVLQRVFSKYGVVLRIATFTKRGLFCFIQIELLSPYSETNSIFTALLQALIEFDQLISAVQAMSVSDMKLKRNQTNWNLNQINQNTTGIRWSKYLCWMLYFGYSILKLRIFGCEI
jgi:hypothetical protein